MTKDQKQTEQAVSDALAAMDRAKQLPVWDDINHALHVELDTIFKALAALSQVRGKAQEPVVDDLAMLVRRLVRQLEKVDPGKDLGPQALDYLRRKGLQGSPLRDAPQPDAQQSSGKERSWLEIGKAVERACKELPEGAELHIELENGYGGARLYLDPVGDDDPGYVNDEWLGDEFADRINNAIEYAIEQKESE